MFGKCCAVLSGAEQVRWSVGEDELTRELMGRRVGVMRAEPRSGSWAAPRGSPALPPFLSAVAARRWPQRAITSQQQVLAIVTYQPARRKRAYEGANGPESDHERSACTLDKNGGCVHPQWCRGASL